MLINKLYGVAAILLLVSLKAVSQQIPDRDFDPVIKHPIYPNTQGPLIKVDEGHNNFHTISNRYAAFANILKKDGYRVDANRGVFTTENLSATRILVIANAVNKVNLNNWSLPTPSAFTDEEIKVVKTWVANGGSLFLIADHMPMAGAAKKLAAAFGVDFYNGFATDTVAGLYPGSKKELDVFTIQSNTLGKSPVINGRNSTEQVNAVATFTGQAFKLPAGALSLLTFNDRYKILLPDSAWKFSSATKRLSIKGFSQGGVLKFGKGRVAVFGEAAMFTAQLKGKNKVPFGLNAPDAPQNVQFLLNLVHWLDSKI